MVERVATALHNASALEKDGPGVLSLSTCRLIARTAIDAMRDADGSMTQLGAEELNPYVSSASQFSNNCELALDVWQAMISEALK